jgi:hypothetical protein
LTEVSGGSPLELTLCPFVAHLSAIKRVRPLHISLKAESKSTHLLVLPIPLPFRQAGERPFSINTALHLFSIHTIDSFSDSGIEIA